MIHRSFYATLMAWAAGVMSLAVGTVVLILIMGEGVDGAGRWAAFVVGFWVVFWGAGLLGGGLAIVFWLAIAWPFARGALGSRWFTRHGRGASSALGGVLGMGSSLLIGSWGGIPVATVLTLAGMVSGWTFAHLLLELGEPE